MVHRQLDRARLQHLGAERGHFEHLFIRNLVDPARLRHHPRIGRVDAVDVGVDIAHLCTEGSSDSHGAGVRTAPAERGHPEVIRYALETRDHGNLAAIDRVRQGGVVKAEDARAPVAVIGLEAQLPAEPGARLEAFAAQRQREQPGRHLLSRGDNHIVLVVVKVAGEVLAGRAIRKGDQLVGLPGHRRHDHGHLLALGSARSHDLGDVGNTVQIANRSAPEFQYCARHFAPTGYLPCNGRPISAPLGESSARIKQDC